MRLFADGAMSRGHGVWVPAFARTTAEFWARCMADAASPSRSSWLATIRWRTLADRGVVLAIILAVWQVGSAVVGTYWLSSPWATVSRFVTLMLDGELIRHSGYTLGEAAAGTLIGGMPAVLLPFV